MPVPVQSDVPAIPGREGLNVRSQPVVSGIFQDAGAARYGPGIGREDPTIVHGVQSARGFVIILEKIELFKCLLV